MAISNGIVGQARDTRRAARNAYEQGQEQQRQQWIADNPEMSALYGEFGVDQFGEDRASQLRAAIARQDWERYQDLFMPLEDVLLNTVQNPQYRQQQAMQAYQSAQVPSERYAQSAQRRAESYGLNMSPEQQKAQERSQAFGEAATRTSAYNNALRLAQDRETKLLGAGLTGVPQ